MLEADPLSLALIVITEHSLQRSEGIWDGASGDISTAINDFPSSHQPQVFARVEGKASCLCYAFTTIAKSRLSVITRPL